MKVLRNQDDYMQFLCGEFSDRWGKETFEKAAGIHNTPKEYPCLVNVRREEAGFEDGPPFSTRHLWFEYVIDIREELVEWHEKLKLLEGS